MHAGTPGKSPGDPPMKDFNIRHMLAVLPIVVAIAAAVFIVQAGTHDAAIAPVRQAVDMDVPF